MRNEKDSVLFYGDGAFPMYGAISAQLALRSHQVKAVGFLPKNNPMMAMAVEWSNRVNKDLKDKVSVNYLGGPEITALLNRSRL